MKEEFKDQVNKILSNKMLALPVKKGKVEGLKTEGERHGKSFILGLPFSVVENPCMDLFMSKVPNISVVDKGEIKNYFDLKPISIVDIDITNILRYGRDVAEKRVPPFNVNIRMKPTEFGVARCCRYDQLVEDLSRDLFATFCALKKESLPLGFAKSCTDEFYKKAFLDFIKSFDAIQVEFAKPNDVRPVCYDAEGFRTGLPYENGKVTLLRLPTTTKEQKNIRTQVLAQIKTRRNTLKNK